MNPNGHSSNSPFHGPGAPEASARKLAFTSVHSAPRRPGTTIDRLMARVDKNGPLHPTKPEKGQCWISGHRKVGNGYPQIYSHRPDGTKSQQYTHRVMWEHLNGPIPSDMVVMHTCDNRACCNPHHLELGTQADNVRDMMKKDRARLGTRMSLPEIGRIKALRAAGSTIVQIAKTVSRDPNTVRNALRQLANPEQPDLFGFPA